MDPIDALAAELRQSIGRLVRAARREADALPATHATTLGFLQREGPMTIAELARRRGVKHQGQSRTVGELAGLGFVDRTASDTDRRATVIRITDAGRAALQHDTDARTDWLAEALRQETDAEERALLSRLPELFERVARRAD
ncbi:MULTISPECIES: MarR family winged helix-turn-helix transcriptional regulator [Curtobacterium]|jgi:DNA-binding MarR family transcriptional regulator|uniref:MarR family winged helix-turn-helix transcriptional regulator n=1 Tax=Curtobacterium TaxID=2034 RepID=UPI0005ACF94F|nr:MULTISPECIES: MarR family transcriptional regulator [Curtobacterium]KIQ10209.1 MarR family transcriptional regulator [Curtobacterium flaccumfaciens]MBT1619631.1 MarR family transcriptional regulator [Curtobacterium flaccumfaciens pv. poinsettiae]MCS6563993.1 MarR family transcriptional regulator [Curtobacterium flaccumfaciens pv. flaccumfaciens]MDD1385569.1 MarR family transcriptional regulator [Curtobacterium flaccumfaciens pv. poinsettiae]MDQ0540431.1 DNA-binding MarR family transcription